MSPVVWLAIATAFGLLAYLYAREERAADRFEEERDIFMELYLSEFERAVELEKEREL